MNSKLKHFQVRHSVSWDVLVTIDPDKFPDHSEQALKNLAAKTAGSWADDQHFEQWSYTDHAAAHINVVDESMAVETYDFCHASVMPNDKKGLEYTSYEPEY